MQWNHKPPVYSPGYKQTQVPLKWVKELPNTDIRMLLLFIVGPIGYRPILSIFSFSFALLRQKFNIPFGYHLLTISLTRDKQRIILVKDMLTKYFLVDSLWVYGGCPSYNMWWVQAKSSVFKQTSNPSIYFYNFSHSNWVDSSIMNWIVTNSSWHSGEAIWACSHQLNWWESLNLLPRILKTNSYQDRWLPCRKENSPWSNTEWCCSYAIPYNTMQYHAIPCNTMQYHAIGAIPRNTMQYHAIPRNTMWYHAIPCNTMWYHAIPCNTIQCHAIPCNTWNTMQYHVIPCNTMQYHDHELIIYSFGNHIII